MMNKELVIKEVNKYELIIKNFIKFFGGVTRGHWFDLEKMYAEVKEDICNREMLGCLNYNKIFAWSLYDKNINVYDEKGYFKLKSQNDYIAFYLNLTYDSEEIKKASICLRIVANDNIVYHTTCDYSKEITSEYIHYSNRPKGIDFSELSKSLFTADTMYQLSESIDKVLEINRRLLIMRNNYIDFCKLCDETIIEDESNIVNNPFVPKREDKEIPYETIVSLLNSYVYIDEHKARCLIDIAKDRGSLGLSYTPNNITIIYNKNNDTYDFYVY